MSPRKKGSGSKKQQSKDPKKRTRTKLKARRIRKRKITRDPTRLEIIQVAAIIGEDYQAARTAILKGAFGPTKYDDHSRKLTVARSAVSLAHWQAWKSSRKTPKQDVQVNDFGP